VGEGFWNSFSSLSVLMLQQGKLSAIVFHFNMMHIQLNKTISV
jgi:hypothetical protein